MLFALILIAAASTADADAAYSQQHYQQAATLYAALVRDDATNARAWYRLGVSDAVIGRDDEAASALTRALTLGYDPMSVHYRLASVASARGDANTAASELSAAYKARPFDPDSLADDHAFDAIRTVPAFTQMIAATSRAFHPCRYDIAFHALDFWKGDWNVTANGFAAGTSHIEAAADQCVISERWQGTYGAPGASISTYDSAAKQWVQHYVSGAGAVTDYTGRVLSDGSVEFVTGTGQTRARMTYTRLPNGSVRHRFESSKDGGATWTLRNDLIYNRAQNAAVRTTP